MSGRKPRSIKEEWVLDIMDKCKEKDVKFFFKQWGGTNKKKAGRDLKGKQYNDKRAIEFLERVEL